MNVLAIDIGGKTRNGFCLMDIQTANVIDYSFLIYDTKETPMYHRFKVLKEVRRYLDTHKVDMIIFERINLFRGSSVSPLANIVSLCKLQTTLIDNLSDRVPMYDVAVNTWKAISLGSGKADKDDSIKKVQDKYPQIELKLPKYKIKDPDAFVYNHDLADAVCIALAVHLNKSKMVQEEHKINFK